MSRPSNQRLNSRPRTVVEVTREQDLVLFLDVGVEEPMKIEAVGLLLVANKVRDHVPMTDVAFPPDPRNRVNLRVYGCEK